MKPIIGLATGQGGTTTLAEYLRQAGFNVTHEYGCAMKRHWALFNWYPFNPKLATRVHVELAQSITGDGDVSQLNLNVMDNIRALFPKSCFLWMARNGYDVVRSQLARGWRYNKEDVPKENHTITPVDFGIMPQHAWNNLTRAGQCAWHWNWCHTRINNSLGDYMEGYWKRFKLEELDKRGPDILRWLGAKHIPPRVPVKNAMPEGVECPKLDDEEMDDFVRMAKPMMDYLGYELP